MKFRLALAALITCVVAGFMAPVAGAAMHDGHDGRCVTSGFSFFSFR
jgi:hypothetical protein